MRLSHFALLCTKRKAQAVEKMPTYAVTPSKTLKLLRIEKAAGQRLDGFTDYWSLKALSFNRCKSVLNVAVCKCCLNDIDKPRINRNAKGAIFKRLNTYAFTLSCRING